VMNGLVLSGLERKVAGRTCLRESYELSCLLACLSGCDSIMIA